MKSFVAAIAFLTRIPVGLMVVVDAADVARSAGWFPLVGLMVGSIGCLAIFVLRGHLPPAVVAVLIVILDALLTGALHYDGLADTADGLGGGRTRDDVLRIMREHSIGSYGGLALACIVALKVTAYAALLRGNAWIAPCILAPALGRWSILLLTATLRYARESESAIGGMGKRALFQGTLTIVLALTAARSQRPWIAGAGVVAVTTMFGWWCRRRIGGITGDTLGANVELCESFALLAFLWTGGPQ